MIGPAVARIHHPPRGIQVACLTAQRSAEAVIVHQLSPCTYPPSTKLRATVHRLSPCTYPPSSKSRLRVSTTLQFWPCTHPPSSSSSHARTHHPPSLYLPSIMHVSIIHQVSPLSLVLSFSCFSFSLPPSLFPPSSPCIGGRSVVRLVRFGPELVAEKRGCTPCSPILATCGSTIHQEVCNGLRSSQTSERERGRESEGWRASREGYQPPA